MVELQLPVAGGGKLSVSRGRLGDLITIERQTVRVQHDGTIVIQDIGAARLGCVVLGIIRGDDLGGCSRMEP